MTLRRTALPLLAALALVVAGCKTAGPLPSAGTGARPPVQVEVRYGDKHQLDRAVATGMDLFGVDVEKGLAYGQTDAEGLAALKRSGLAVRVTPQKAFGASNHFDKGYRTYEQLTSDLQALAAKHPRLMSLKSIGPSWETQQGKADRQIWATRITGPGDASQRPAVAFTANLHARELVTVEVAMRLMTLLLEGYENDPAIRKLVDTRVVHIMPMVNPDGHHQAEKGHNWRKNTHPFERGTGVDLNRNFPFKWGNTGASGQASSDIYAGPGPASEPETQAIKAHLSSIPNLKIGMDYHSYSNLIMWSWGWTDAPPKDAKMLSTIGKKLASFNGYKPIQACELYTTSGTIRDFVYGTLDVPYFTTEIGGQADGFDPPFSRVEKLWAENKSGALYLLSIADDPNQVLKAAR